MIVGLSVFAVLASAPVQAQERVSSAPAEIMAFVGRAPVYNGPREVFDGWSSEGGAVLNFQHGQPMTMASFHRRDGELLIVAKEEVGRDPANADLPDTRIRDAVVVALDSGEDFVGYECRVGMDGAFEPYLIGVLDGRQATDYQSSGLLGPAIASVRVDPQSRRISVEDRPVFCVDEAAGL